MDTSKTMVSFKNLENFLRNQSSALVPPRNAGFNI